MNTAEKLRAAAERFERWQPLDTDWPEALTLLAQAAETFEWLLECDDLIPDCEARPPGTCNGCPQCNIADRVQAIQDYAEKLGSSGRDE